MHPPLIAPVFQSWSASDGYPLQGRFWPPANSPPADQASRRRDGPAGHEPQLPAGALYLHGIQSHGGWYEWSASVLASAGLPVVMPDRRGSGLNQRDRGRIRSAGQWLDDLDLVAAWLRDMHGCRRVAIVAVSWGARVALLWAANNPDRVDRLMLIAPGIFPAVDVPISTRLRIARALLAGRGDAEFELPLSDPSLFTGQPAGQAFIRADPMKLERVSARFLYESHSLLRRVRRLRSGVISCPVTMLLAGRDRIIRNEPTFTWLQRVAGRPPEVIEFPDAAHTIEFEPIAAPYAPVASTLATRPACSKLPSRGAGPPEPASSNILPSPGTFESCLRAWAARFHSPIAAGPAI